MLPFECSVKGTPLSLQSKSKQKWKKKVSLAAASEWKELPLKDIPLSVLIVYFYPDAHSNVDIDNIIKPIQDALNKNIFEDDKQVDSVTSKRQKYGGYLSIKKTTPQLIEGLSSGEDFVYIKINYSKDLEEFL